MGQCHICGKEKDDVRMFCGFNVCGSCFEKETGGDINDDEAYTADANRAHMREVYAELEGGDTAGGNPDDHSPSG
jgi:hypothetical protein